MADIILPSIHPAKTLSSDNDLAVVLELEDPHQMATDRLQELIRDCKDVAEPAVWGYLYGIWESREYFGRN
jgi:hypothetical protein